MTFRLPDAGPGGTFANGSKTEILTTHADGRAGVWGMKWNRQAGTFDVRITATKGEARAGTVSSQHLTETSGPSAPKLGSANHKWLWIALVAGAAGAGAAVAARKPFRIEQLLFYGGLAAESLHLHAKLAGCDHHRPAHDQSGVIHETRDSILRLSSVCVWAQSGLSRPALGRMIDRQQVLRPVYGVGGGFHVDAPIAEGVLSSACSPTLCLAKTEAALISAGVATPAPAGEAVIALDTGGATTGATVYFPSVQQFERWQNGALTPLSVNVYGTVLALGSNASGLTIAIERSGIVWIVSSGGTILDSLPPASARCC